MRLYLGCGCTLTDEREECHGAPVMVDADSGEIFTASEIYGGRPAGEWVELLYSAIAFDCGHIELAFVRRYLTASASGSLLDGSAPEPSL